MADGGVCVAVITISFQQSRPRRERSKTHSGFSFR
jgi:hypothetical protein